MIVLLLETLSVDTLTNCLYRAVRLCITDGVTERASLVFFRILSIRPMTMSHIDLIYPEIHSTGSLSRFAQFLVYSSIASIIILKL